MALLQISAVLFLALSAKDAFAQRIIGGQEVLPYSIKYQASLQTETGQHYCVMTLDITRVVLSEHSLTVTERFEQIFNVSKIYVHNYNYKTFNNDIMIIKLSEPAVLNANVQPADLPDESTPQLFDDICTVSGWGVTQIYSLYLSPVLRAVDVRIQPYCSYYYWGRITSNMLCAGSQLGGKDSCQGDSGGPLVCNGYFEGIVSWGISCANPYFPGVYTRVRNYIQWINWIIENDTP
uniref:trypsin n=1 Tax=Anabas testudineus TaxID=64144 RepID=A0A3Q1JPN3_ANATE